VKRILIIGAAVAGAVLLFVLLAGGNSKTQPVEFTEGGVAVKVQLLSSVGDDRVRVTLNPEAFEGRIVATAKLEVSGELAATGPVEQPRSVVRKELPFPVYSASTVHLEIPVKRASDKPGRAVVKVTFQACDKLACQPSVIERSVTLDLK
jgi:hypothetical protein